MGAQIVQFIRVDHCSVQLFQDGVSALYRLHTAVLIGIAADPKRFQLLQDFIVLLPGDGESDRGSFLPPVL